MNNLEVTMLVTVMANYDVLPAKLPVKGFSFPLDTSRILEHAKSGERWALYLLNNQVISRRGRLLRK